MLNRLARKKSSGSLRRSASASSTSLGLDQKSAEAKTVQYIDSRCPRELKLHGVYLDQADRGPVKEDVDECKRLLAVVQEFQEGSIFDDDRFLYACRELQDENEAAIFLHMTHLVVPSVKDLKMRRAHHGGAD